MVAKFINTLKNNELFPDRFKMLKIVHITAKSIVKLFKLH